EEWRLVPEQLSIEALVALPSGLAMLVGLATVADGAEPVPDDEHDEWAWWPADVVHWPDDIEPQLRTMGEFLSAWADRSRRGPPPAGSRGAVVRFVLLRRRRSEARRRALRAGGPEARRGARRGGARRMAAGRSFPARVRPRARLGADRRGSDPFRLPRAVRAVADRDRRPRAGVRAGRGHRA